MNVKTFANMETDIQDILKKLYEELTQSKQNRLSKNLQSWEQSQNRISESDWRSLSWILSEAETESLKEEFKNDTRSAFIYCLNGASYSGWGGAREGAGRPATGRKRKTFYITDVEETKLREYLAELRG